MKGRGMSEFYLASNDIDVLAERVNELSRIRQGYTTQLGSSLYDATKDIPDLRWGRESLYEGIADCDAERSAILARIEELTAGTGEEPEATDVEPDVVADAVANQAETDTVADESEAVAVEEEVAEEEPVIAVAPEPEPEPEPEFEFEPLPAPEPIPVPETPVPASPSASDTASIPLQETVVTPIVSVPAATPQNTCPKCGAATNPGDKFCMECGSPLAAPKPVQPAPQPQPQVCPACGSPVEPTFKFCMTCGHKLA